MTELLIFFALPIATIIFSIALQRLLDCPFLVAGVIFAIFLVVTFVIGNLMFLIATIVYTIIAFITAVIVMWITRENEEHNRCRRHHNDSNNNNKL